MKITSQHLKQGLLAFLILFIFTAIPFVALVAQEVADTVAATAEPVATVFQQVFMDLFGQHFVTIAGYEAAVVGLAAIINTYLVKTENDLVRQIVAIVVAIAIGIAGHLVDVGIFMDTSIGMVLTFAINTGLASNGLFKFVKSSSKQIKAMSKKAEG